MLYWLFQIVYALSVLGWLASAVLMLREFFTEYRGRVYDDSNLSHNAGLPDHGDIEVLETTEYRTWKLAKIGRVKRWLKVFGVCLALHIVLHLVQSEFMPSFDIPFYSEPVPSPSQEDTDTPPG